MCRLGVVSKGAHAFGIGVPDSGLAEEDSGIPHPFNILLRISLNLLPSQTKINQFIKHVDISREMNYISTKSKPI